MNRRAFLGVFGCGMIGLATDWSGALKGIATTGHVRPLEGGGLVRVYELIFMPTDEVVALHTIQRLNGAVVMQLHSPSTLRWVAATGCEIVTREGFDLNIESSPHGSCDWVAYWDSQAIRSVTGCAYCGTAYYDWPAGGHCRQCGGALPDPMQSMGGRWATSMIGGMRRQEALELPIVGGGVRIELARCDYCGSSLECEDCCASCGAGALP